MLASSLCLFYNPKRKMAFPKQFSEPMAKRGETREGSCSFSAVWSHCHLTSGAGLYWLLLTGMPSKDVVLTQAKGKSTKQEKQKQIQSNKKITVLSFNL